MTCSCCTQVSFSCSSKRIEVAQKQADKPKKKDLSKMTPVERRAHMQAEQKEKMRQKQEDLQKEIQRLTDAGESWVMWKAMQNMMAKERAEAQKIKDQNKKHVRRANAPKDLPRICFTCSLIGNACCVCRSNGGNDG